MSILTVYLGSFKKGPGGAVIQCAFDTESGKLTETGRLNTVRPSYLLLDPEHKLLYCIREANEIDGVYGGGIECIDVSGKKMVSLSRQSLGGKGPAHLCLRDGWLITALYGEGGLTETRVKNGVIEPVRNIIRHIGKGTDPERQEQPHPHYVSFMPDGAHLAVCDLGLDRIFVYPYRADTGISLFPDEIEAPAGSGPRHLVWSWDNRMMYVVTEMGGTLLTYLLTGNGKAQLSGCVSTLPERFAGENTCAAIRMNRMGNELVISNRGHDSLAFFRLDENGMPYLTGRVSTGLWPRDVEFSPDGKWLLCANQNSDTVDVYSYRSDGDDAIEKRVRLIEENRFHTDTMPCCIVFSDEN